MSDETAEPKRRPIFLGVALVAMSLVGLHASSTGWGTIEIITDPFAGADWVSRQADPAAEAANQALVEGVRERAPVLLPIGIAQLLLGGLLLLVGFNALLGRRASRGFALQVIAANLLLLVVSFVLREPLRQAIIEAWVTTGSKAPPFGLDAEDFESAARIQGWWLFRLELAAELIALGLSAFALTRPSVKEMLAPPEPSADEEF